MIWVMYGLFCAFFFSLASLLKKKILNKEHALQFLVTNSLLSAIGISVFFPLVSLSLDFNLLILLYVKSVILSLSWILLYKAYRHMEISAAEPLRNLSPLFLAVLAFFLLGEMLSITNIIGIVIIVIGAYIIEVDHSWTHVIKNLSILKNKHIGKLILSMMLVSFCAIIDKILIGSLNLYTILFFTYWFVFLNTFIVFSYKYNGYHGIIHTIKRNNIFLFLVVILTLSADYFFFTAINVPGALISLVVPIKRMSTLFTTIIGGGLFHDHGLKTRIIGTMVALLGVIMVIF